MQVPTREPRFFYGWVIVATVWLANFVTVTMNPIVFAFFLDHMVQDLGVSRATLVWGITIRLISGGLFAPYLGRYVDRHGSRWAGVVAGLTVGVVLAGFALASNIWVLYAMFFISGLTGFGIFGGNVLTMVPPANWFVAKRGRAVTIASSGQLFGTAAFAIFSAVLIETFGWRQAWGIFSVVAVLGTVPTYAIFMRRRPEDMGLLPDGMTAIPVVVSSTSSGATRNQADFTVREALRTPVLWLNLASTTLLMLAISPMILFRNHYWDTLGFTPTLIALGVALDPFTVAATSIAMGFVAERLPIRFAMAVGGIWRFFGMLPLALGMTWPGSVILHNLVWGVGSGASSVFQTLMIPEYFGRTHQGAIRGAVTPIQIAVSSLGAPLGGYLLDSGMSYLTFFWIVIVAVSIASASALFQLPPKHKAQAEFEGVVAEQVAR